jgi:hypothetical protein
MSYASSDKQCLKGKRTAGHGVTLLKVSVPKSEARGLCLRTVWATYQNSA